MCIGRGSMWSCDLVDPNRGSHVQVGWACGVWVRGKNGGGCTWGCGMRCMTHEGRSHRVWLWALACGGDRGGCTHSTCSSRIQVCI